MGARCRMIWIPRLVVGPDGQGMLSRTTTHDVSVLPVQTPAYRFLSPSGSWTAAVFNVSLDGQLLVDDEYRQTFHVEGSTLRVTGFVITIDGRALPHDLTLDGFTSILATLTRDQTHTVALLPLQGPYTLRAQPPPLPTYRFMVDADGTVVLLDPGPLVFRADGGPPAGVRSPVSELRRSVDDAEIEFDRFDTLVNTNTALAGQFGPARNVAKQRLDDARSVLAQAIAEEPPIWADSDPFRRCWSRSGWRCATYPTNNSPTPKRRSRFASYPTTSPCTPSNPN